MTFLAQICPEMGKLPNYVWYFYGELDQQEQRCDDDQPVAEESEQFWGKIWNQSADHKKDAKWLRDLQSEVNVKKLEKIDITTGSLKKIFGRMPC